MIKINIQLFADNVDGSVIIGTEMDTSGVDVGLKDVISKITGKLKNVGGKVLKNIGNGIVKISKTALKILGTTGRLLGELGLASGLIVGILGFFALIAKAVELVLEQNKSITANFQYLAFVLSQMITNIAQALTGTIKSALEWILDLLFEILRVVGLIINHIFNIDVFKDTGAEDFQKSMKASEKSAKAIRKELAGFDEMDVLGSNTRASGGAGSGTAMPTLKMPEMGGEVPEWLQWIFDHGAMVVSLIGGITGALLAMKLGIGGLTSLGIGAILATIIKLIIDIVGYIKDPSWNNMLKILKDLSLLITEVGIALVFLNASNPLGWIILAIGAIGLLITNFDKLAEAIGLNKTQIKDSTTAIEEYQQAIDNTKRAQDDYIRAVDNATEAEKKLKDAEDKNKISGKELFDMVRQGKIDYKNMTDAQKEVYKAYRNNLIAQRELKGSTDELIEAKNLEDEKYWDTQISLAHTTGDYQKLRDEIVKATEDETISVDKAQDLIAKAMGDMSDDSYNTFIKEIPDNIKEGLNPDKYRTAWSRLKANWNSWFDSLKKNLNMSWGSSLGGHSSGGGVYGAKGLILYPSMPKLARGGIVNMPGSGISYGGATIGERGAEAVLPLTDSQQMALLGEAIGKFITVNATITNTMNGRVISRELQRVQNDNDFAYNR